MEVLLRCLVPFILVSLSSILFFSNRLSKASTLDDDLPMDYFRELIRFFVGNQLLFSVSRYLENARQWYQYIALSVFLAVSNNNGNGVLCVRRPLLRDFLSKSPLQSSSFCPPHYEGHCEYKSILF